MAETSTPPSGGKTASEFRDIADALRNRVDLFGKALAAVATLGTTAVGLTKIGDLFPADGNVGWVVAACVGLAVAALAAIWVAVRLMRVARPVFMDVNPDTNEDLDGGERDEIRPVYAAAARRFGYRSLIGLQERERSLRTAASRTIDKEERARRTALADEVKLEMEQALARSQVVVIRRRATRAVSGPVAWTLYCVVIGGLILFALGADKVASDRNDPVAAAKACADARKAGATAGELKRTNGICDRVTNEPEEKPPSAAEARAQITATLAAALQACAALVHKEGDAKSGPLTNMDCDPVRKAVSAMDQASP